MKTVKESKKKDSEFMDKLNWRVHVPNLFQETIDNNVSAWPLRVPYMILSRILFEVGENAARINDPVLNELMCRLTIYSVADPTSNDYDPDVLKEVIKKSEQFKKSIK